MKSILFLYSALVISDSYSFTPSLSYSSCSCTSTTTKNTQLNLVPKQGCQLAAAQAAEFARKKVVEGNNHNDIGVVEEIRPTDATREFVSRLFHLPFGNRTPKEEGGSSLSSSSSSSSSTSSSLSSSSSLSQQQEFQPSFEFKFPENNNENNSNSKNDHHHRDNVVLFPIVGFQYVKLQDGTMRGIPTINASPEKAVCNFESKNKCLTQPVYGWYSKCCFLGDLYANDNEYCGQARYLKVEEEKKKGREFEPYISEMLGS